MPQRQGHPVRDVRCHLESTMTPALDGECALTPSSEPDKIGHLIFVLGFEDAFRECRLLLVRLVFGLKLVVRGRAGVEDLALLCPS